MATPHWRYSTSTYVEPVSKLTCEQRRDRTEVGARGSGFTARVVYVRVHSHLAARTTLQQECLEVCWKVALHACTFRHCYPCCDCTEQSYANVLPNPDGKLRSQFTKLLENVVAFVFRQ